MLIGRYHNKATDVYCHEAIDRFDYEFYVIKRLQKLKCTCLDHTTKDPNPECEMCLGLGTRIKIFKVTGAATEMIDANMVRTTVGGSTPKTFYFQQKCFIERDDVVVDNEDFFRAYKCQHLRGRDGEFQTTRVVASTVIANKQALKRNFNKILNGRKH